MPRKKTTDPSHTFTKGYKDRASLLLENTHLRGENTELKALAADMSDYVHKSDIKTLVKRLDDHGLLADEMLVGLEKLGIRLSQPATVTIEIDIDVDTDEDWTPETLQDALTIDGDGNLESSSERCFVYQGARIKSVDVRA